MIRHYLNKLKHKKFTDFCKINNADYIEYDASSKECSCKDETVYGVWKIPTKCGDHFMAIKLYRSGRFEIGSIDEACDNFTRLCGDTLFPDEAKWLIQTLPIVNAYCPLLKK